MRTGLVSVVVPTFNRKGSLIRLLQSLEETTYPSMEVIVVDDASCDGTSEAIAHLFPNVRCIRNQEEQLLAGSRNIGIKASQGEFVLVIDDDNVVSPIAIQELVSVMRQHPDVGVVGPLMLYYNDRQRIWCAGVNRSMITSITTLLGNNQMVSQRYSEVAPSLDFPNVLLLRRSILEETGLFDSDAFPIHYDEADLCQRIRDAGYQILVIPSARVWHDIPVPILGEARERRLGLSRLRAFYAARGRIVFHRKYSRGINRVLCLCLFIPAITLYYIIRILVYAQGDRRGLIFSYLHGTFEGLGVRL